jgi:PAS domain S-box-containing protein
VTYDITQQKRAEEALAEKEAQLHLALDNMPGGMLLFDRDMNYVLFNSQYSELCEYPDGLVRAGMSSRDELRYQAERGDFGPGDKDDLIEDVLAIYQRGEAVSYEREIAGSGRTLQVYVAPTPEGGTVTIVTDITERKRTEEALRLSEQRHSMVTMAMTEGLYDWNITQDTLYVSPWLREIFGFESIESATRWVAITGFRTAPSHKETIGVVPSA